MTDFFDLIGASNRAKIRYIKIEIDVHSLFLGNVPFSAHYISYAANTLLGRGASEPDVHAQMPSLETAFMKDHPCKSIRKFILSTAALIRVADPPFHDILRIFA